MKLKSLLPAPLLLASLAATSAAQGGAVESREGDSFRGPVKSVRIERVLHRRVGGELVEGPRQLVGADTYAPDGRRREHDAYSANGKRTGRRVFVYDDAGREVEQSVFDAAGNLQTRIVRRPAEGEVLTYHADGSLRERRVVTKSPDGRVVELRIYDGAGALNERSETSSEGGVAVTRVYGPDGVLKRSGERGPGDAPGVRRMVVQTYNPDGTVLGRMVSDVSHAGNAMVDRVSDNDGHNPGPRKTRETREYDSRGNLSKITNYVWNAEAGGYEPAAVTYYTLTYYR